MVDMVLVHPRIASNVGNVARLCAANHISLHLVKPYGFLLTDRHLKRAGLDYWDQVTLVEHDSLECFENRMQKEKRNVWYITKLGCKLYTEAAYQKEDYLVFGSEEFGLPKELLARNTERSLKIPMANPNVRCLNLATAAGIVLYEALRQMQP